MQVNVCLKMKRVGEMMLSISFFAIWKPSGLGIPMEMVTVYILISMKTAATSVTDPTTVTSVTDPSTATKVADLGDIVEG